VAAVEPLTRLPVRLRLLLVLFAALLGWAGRANVVDAEPHIYDVPQLARVAGEVPSAARNAFPQVSGPLAGRAQRSASIRGTSTTSVRSFIATEAGPDLSAFGNRAGPRAPRPVDMEVGPDGMLVSQRAPAPTGASTYTDPAQAPLSGHYHTIPEGTPMPPGMAVVRDGVDVGGLQPATHATIFPTEPMTPGTFIDRFLGLPWQYGGKK
jgi:hypothetical protein